MPETATPTDLTKLARECGVIGAGGAGFPTYRKLESSLDIVIANGAECEPLLYKDQHLMEHYASDVVAGLLALQQATGAGRAVIGIKAKNLAALAAVRSAIAGTKIEVSELDDVYPAGDEVDLVHHVIGRQIPTGGLPLEVGVVVNNVETLVNLHRAGRGEPVTHKLISVVGAVAEPRTFWVPVGVSYSQVLAFCGGATVPEVAIVDGGPMMGRVSLDLETPITKTCGGLIVLPADHHLVRRKTEPEQQYKRVGKSACDQCMLCTELCPRYLLGYPVQPHLVMRALEFSGPQSRELGRWAQVCSECNICSLYACPEELNPRDMCRSAKQESARTGENWDRPELAALTGPAHPLRSYRQVPTKQLKRRLGLEEWDRDASLVEDKIIVDRVALPLDQHLGVPATPIVRVGDEVSAGDIIAKVEGDQLGAWLHASIDGRITGINGSIDIEVSR
ncbi:MAG: 4Fe-4S dicluster domain-containing protein [Candidatus Neomarinimicrobiota bacterium]